MIETDKVSTLAQDNLQATTYIKQRSPADSEIDTSLTLKEAFWKIRACSPEHYPAFFYINGQKVYINVWRENKPKDEFDMI